MMLIADWRLKNADFPAAEGSDESAHRQSTIGNRQFP
jgi:hypothetical protein